MCSSVRGRICVACALVLFGIVASGCFISSPGSGAPANVTDQRVLFSDASAFQTAAKKCATAACEDADLNAAIQDYQKVLKIDPLNQYAYYDAGVVYYSTSQVSAASDAFQKCLLIQPTYFPAIFDLAIIDSTSAPATAVQLYQEAESLKPAPKNIADAYFNLGLLYDKLGKHQAGNAQIEDAVRMDPSLSGQLSKIPAADVPPGLVP
jgi:tetratricopeptide (TPR) repeat protein